MGVFYRAGEFIGGISKELADKIGKVVQTPSNSNDEFYELLFSKTADNTERTEETRKCSTLQYNPNKSAITIGSRTPNSDIGTYSVAMGILCTASGAYSHAESVQTTASGAYSHSEGLYTTASGVYSHSEGFNTVASGQGSHAEGDSTIANHRSQHVFGEYNIEDPSQKDGEEQGNYIEIVGNGTTNIIRSNARTLDWDGNEMLAGSLSLAGASSDISLTGTGNTWDGTNISLKSALSAKATKATTLAGYGITDAKITNGTITLGSNSITPLTSHQDISGKVSKSGDTMTGLLTSNTAHDSAWNKARDNAFIRSLGFANQGSYYPAIVWRHQDGDWSMGSLGNSKRLYFSHIRDAEYSGNNNTDNYYIDPPADGNGHSYQLAHSGNVGTGDSNGQVKIAGTNVSVKGWTDFLPLAGGTVTGTLILSRTQDASGTANNKPALIVGGTDTQVHIEIDNNEILAKENGTTIGNLYLQDGGSLHLCADTYAFDKGRLNFAKALTNSNVSAPNYVVGLTNSWGAFGYTALSALATTMLKVQETKISFKFSIALGAHSGMTFANARGSAFSVSVPSGYTLMCNVYCCANGFGGLWATLDGDVYTSTSPGIYLYNSSNSTLSTSTTVTVRVVSVFRKS